MYHAISRLLLYSDLGENEILVCLARILRDWERGTCDRDQLVGRINAQVKRLLDLNKKLEKNFKSTGVAAVGSYPTEWLTTY